MSALVKLWGLLEQVSSFEFSSLPGKGSKTGWQGNGAGALIHETVDNNSCFILEKGTFSIEGGKALEMSNEWLWENKEGVIRLSHVRRGRSYPVMLFELRASDESGSQVVSTPHRCGRDIYKATVVLEANGFDMSWSITGPKKEENLFYRYR